MHVAQSTAHHFLQILRRPDPLYSVFVLDVKLETIMTKFFRWAFPSFLAIAALVVGGAWYQTISIVPFWQQHISMFKNYGHWGTSYFLILSPLMTVLWLVVLITGMRAKFSNRAILYTGHFLFLLIMVSTFVYFAPFLLTYMC